MELLNVLKRLRQKPQGKIILIVFDGLGGIPREPGGPTELESARKPNLDALAGEGTCGLLDNVLPGLTPGSGPAHLSLFGYDPLIFDIGRGLLGALGIGFPIQPGDLAVRVNFCTTDPATGFVTDRRAGRIATETNEKLVAMLNAAVSIPGCEVFVRTEKEHRACVVFRADGLYDAIAETDPQTTGKEPPRLAAALDARSEKAAGFGAEFARQAAEVLKDQHPANNLLMRGYARFEKIPLLTETYDLRFAAIATYPMYRGVANLVGMDILPDAGDTMESEFACLARHFADYDFFFLHIKKTDSYGEDGNWDAKVHVIEEADALIPRARALDPAVLCVTADHSTPCVLKAHSWHPVPVAVWARWGRPDSVPVFSERACAGGGLGRMRGIHLMPILVAHALGLEKYGA
ncbi:MAG TPA: 2,3-bisphosphoglycerate-independent phosphoglycerate mutase [Planctomycetota bacterium]|nr:2,3-bisphosphoglycerate-independent phosphoglycerate mutase [Planctomycetota bacterium]